LNEVESVSGSDFVVGGVAVTDVAAGLEVAAAGGALAAAFSAGYVAGTWLNNTFGLSDKVGEFLAVFD